jgi:hypothetical protein
VVRISDAKLFARLFACLAANLVVLTIVQSVDPVRAQTTIQPAREISVIAEDLCFLPLVSSVPVFVCVQFRATI